MTPRNRTLQALAALLPAGALGVSVVLAPSSSKAVVASPEQGKAPEASAAGSGVAARLQAIRNAVSTVTADAADTGGGDPNILKTWWRNGGWGRGWGNGGWHRGWGNGGWGPGWRNGGWGNGGWGNGGWRRW